MKKTTLVILLIGISISLFANDTIPHKNKINLSFSNVQFEDNYLPLNDILVFQLDYNRKINKFISIGGYLSGGMYDEWIKETHVDYLSYSSSSSKFSAHYGLNTNFHILPLIFSRNTSRFDLYASANLGFISMFTATNENIIPVRGTYFDYSFMAGGSIYLSKRFGINIEAGYKEFKYHKGFVAKYGLTYQF